MPRRKPYTKVVKTNQIRAEHVRGMGDVVFKGFQCLNSECQEFIFVRKDEIRDDFEFACPTCKTDMLSGDETQFYEYKLVDERDNSTTEEGTFAILHDNYIEEAREYKSLFEKSFDSVSHQVNGSDVNHSFSSLRIAFIVHSQATKPAKP